MSSPLQKVCAIGDIALNASKAFQLGDRQILICNTRDGFFAVDNFCTHQLQEMEGGKIRSCFIFCPLHGQRFDLRDGRPVGQLTDKPLPTYDLHIEGDSILVSPVPRGDEPG